jgi:DNA/RNA endonuclease G (NUC1)
VLTLEDLARAAEKRIYDFGDFLKNEKFKMLPVAVEIPSFFKFLGFIDIPKSENEVKAKYKEMAQIMHPDKGGNEEDFQRLQVSYEKSLAYICKKEDYHA